MPEQIDNTRVQIVPFVPEEINPSKLRSQNSYYGQGTISPGKEIIGIVKNDDVKQKSLFGRRKLHVNPSLAHRLGAWITDKLHITSPPVYETNGRLYRAEVPITESADGKELERVKDTAANAAKLTTAALFPQSLVTNPIATTAGLLGGVGTYALTNTALNGIETITNKNINPAAKRAATTLVSLPIASRAYAFGNFLNKPTFFEYVDLKRMDAPANLISTNETSDIRNYHLLLDKIQHIYPLFKYKLQLKKPTNIELGKKIGSGYESVVYEHATDPNIVLKAQHNNFFTKNPDNRIISASNPQKAYVEGLSIQDRKNDGVYSLPIKLIGTTEDAYDPGMYVPVLKQPKLKFIADIHKYDEDVARKILITTLGAKRDGYGDLHFGNVGYDGKYVWLFDNAKPIKK